MNLSDKKMLWAMMIIALAFFSCEEENLIGSDINPAEDKLEAKFREFSINPQNVFYDSVRTDVDPYILTGTLTDEIYGKKEATGYRSINIFTANIPSEEAALDSVKINLFVNNWYTDDIRKNHEIVVSQVGETLYSGAVYTSNREARLVRSLEGNLESIGSHTFELIPGVDSVITFPLNQSYGRSLLQSLTLVRNTEPVRVFAPGELSPLAFRSTDANNALIGIDPTDIRSNIVLYYHEPAEPDSVEQFSFFFNSATGAVLPGYNYIETDRTGTPFAAVSGDSVKVVDVAGDFIYMNGASGIYPTVNLSEVYDFFRVELETDATLGIVSAELTLPLNPDDTSAFMPTNTAIRYLFAGEDAEVNASNILRSPGQNTLLTDNSYLGTSGAVTAFGRINPNTFSMSRDITLFTQLLIEDRISPDRGDGFPAKLVIMPSSASSFRQNTFLKEGIKVRVYYTTLK